MTTTITGKVRPADAGGRLDGWFRGRADDLSQGRIRKLIESGACRVDGRVESHPSYRVVAGERIELAIGDAPRTVPALVWNDDDWAAVDKPRGVTVSSDADIRHWSDTVCDGPLRLVHRLDKETSGILLLARHDDAVALGMKWFRRRLCDKTYLAIVEGAFRRDEGTIETLHGKLRSRDGKRRWGQHPEGQEAVTGFRTLSRTDGASLMELRPRTGRTHQLRAHMADGGHPIVGDTLYGKGRLRITAPRMMLHALSLEIPLETGPRRLEAPPPPAFRTLAGDLGLDGI